MFRFLPGIVILQAATAVLVYAALRVPLEEHWLLFALIGLITSLLVAFWFGSIAKRVRRDALARAQEGLAREREKLRVGVEHEKNRILTETHKKIVKETNRAHARANLKVGAALAGTMGLGAVMLMTQFLTLGLFTLTMGGGILAGYVWKARRARLARQIAGPGRAPSGALDLATRPAGLPLLRREAS